MILRTFVISTNDGKKELKHRDVGHQKREERKKREEKTGRQKDN